MPAHFIGVRHHSPACARLIGRAIESLRPAYVLVEGPADINDRLDELLLGHELPIAIRVSGRYHDIGSFAADIANLSRIVTLHNVNLVAAKELSGVLAMEATARTYRYLDPAEIEEVKKTAAAAKAKGGAK